MFLTGFFTFFKNFSNNTDNLNKQQMGLLSRKKNRQKQYWVMKN